MSDRYFVDEPISADRATLAGPEAHHLIHVMRAVPGTRVTLFDGGGDEFPAVVERIGRTDVELSILSRERIDRELPFDLTLGVALPKGDRQKWLVEKAVELGITRIVPLRTRRGVAQPIEQAIMRLRRTVVEASKQCGRNRLLRIDGPQCWPDFIADAVAGATCRLLAQPKKGGATAAGGFLYITRPELQHFSPSGNNVALFGVQRIDVLNDVPVYLAVGPEGGLADEEVDLAVAAGWRAVDLGPRTVRVETASLLLAAMIVQGHTTLW